MKEYSIASDPKRRGKSDDEFIKAPKGESAKSRGSSLLREVPMLGEVSMRRKSKKDPISSPRRSNHIRTISQDGDDEEDLFKNLEFLPVDDPLSGSGPRLPESGIEDIAEYKSSDPGESGPAPEIPPASDASQSMPPGDEALESPRISFPIPDQENSKISPAFQRIFENLCNDGEFYKLHAQYFRMSPT